ncbi:MAG: hypothetical protein ACPL1H_09960, partial [bacterium]
DRGVERMSKLPYCIFRVNAMKFTNIGHGNLLPIVMLSSCEPLPSPVLPTLPLPLPQSKLILNSFSPAHSYISEHNTDTMGFNISASVKPVAGLEPSQTPPQPNNHKGFYLRWTITITGINGIVNVLKGDTPIILMNTIMQGADEFVPVEIKIPWNGIDSKGNILPDGQYFYKLDIQFIRIAHLGNGNTATKFIDELSSGTGSFIIDNTPPDISISTPVNNTVLDSASVIFAVTYSDCGAGIDTSSFSAILNQAQITSHFNINNNMAGWQTTLNNDVYTFIVNIKDKAGNSTGAKAHFTVLAGSAINQYTRIGKGEDIRQGLTAMLAAEDNKQLNYLGFEDNYYNILASFAWNGIRIPGYTVNGQQTNANSIVIAGKLTTPPFSGNLSSAVQPLLSINYQTSSDFPDEQVSFDTLNHFNTAWRDE